THLTGDVVALAQSEPPDLGEGDVDVRVPRQVPGGPQEPVDLGEHGEDAGLRRRVGKLLLALLALPLAALLARPAALLAGGPASAVFTAVASLLSSAVPLSTTVTAIAPGGAVLAGGVPVGGRLVQLRRRVGARLVLRVGIGIALGPRLGLGLGLGLRRGPGGLPVGGRDDRLDQVGLPQTLMPLYPEVA